MENAIYHFVPKCTADAGLVLGIGDAATWNPIQLVPTSAGDRAVWQILPLDGDTFWIRPTFAARGPWGGHLEAPHENSPVEIHSYGTDPNHHGDWDSWRWIRQGDTEWGAIQLVRNIKQNLNVAGNDNYKEGTLIYSYTWGDGAPNELWRLTLVRSFA
jgi:hypothetical protein